MSRTRRKSNGSVGVATSVPAATPATASSPQEGWVGLTRDQLDMSLQSATAWLRGLEAVRKVQWDMTHLALKRYEELRQRLHEVHDLSELMALQVELMRFDSAAAIKTGQELYDATVQSTTEALTQARSTIDSTQSDGMKSWLQSMQSMVHTGVRPLDDLFGNSLLRDLMTPPSTGAAARAPKTG